jgi:histidine ammonia-lyase
MPRQMPWILGEHSLSVTWRVRTWPAPGRGRLSVMREIVVDGSALTVEDVVAMAYGRARASLGPDVPRRMETSRSVVVKALGGGAPVYGVNTGFGALADMLAQYTAASPVSENKVLAHPASVDTIPTSGKQENHVSMDWHAVRTLREVVGNVRACLAVEICCATQGIDLRASVALPSVPLQAVHALVRSSVPRMDIDREVAPQLAAVDTLLPDICLV